MIGETAFSVTFSIVSWSAWRQSPIADGASTSPDVSSIPAMLRRRLNTLGRACASQALPLLEKDNSLPVVYCSQHGDIDRTLSILRDLAESGEVSPMNFSLAVHNAICGVLSIQAGARGPISAIAAGEECLVPALLASVGMLDERHSQVLCLFCDVPLPEVYRTASSLPSAAHASAFIFSKDDLQAQGSRRLSLNMLNSAQTSSDKDLAQTEVANDFCNFLLYDEQQQLSNSHNGAIWTLAKLP